MGVLGIVGLIIGLIGLPLSYLLSRSTSAEAQISLGQLQSHIDALEVVILNRLDRLDDADRRILAAVSPPEGTNV